MAYSIKREEVIKYRAEELKNFKLYIYEWIDNLNFTFDPHLFLEDAEEYIKVASELFREKGWHGDGDIELIWIPPFMVSEYGYNERAFGFVVWHVKQQSDGISWLLSPEKLKFLEK